jgi:hypothetical protein
MSTFNIFFEEEFDAVQAHRHHELRLRVGREDVNYILNVDEQDYVAHLASIFSLDPLELNFDEPVASRHEKEIPADRFPPGFAVQPGKAYKKPIVRYHIPFTGDPTLLRSRPNPCERDTLEVFIEDDAVCFEIPVFRDDPTFVKAAIEQRCGLIRRQFAYLSKQICNYNLGIEMTVRMIFEGRKKELQQQHAFLAELGVKVKKAAGVPSTFTVPASRNRIVLQKPTPGQPAALEPVLGETIYQEILRVVQDTGKAFERMPSTYYDKDEETLRDHLLLQLEPHFEMASSTGETFNKAGKTDILIRYEKQNVFVAECKVWRGPAQHAPTIDQLLSYLTWRDSKTAIIYFVHNKKITEVLEAIEVETTKHPCFVEATGRWDESRFSYRFHLPGDDARNVQLSILCFHMPR